MGDSTKESFVDFSNETPDLTIKDLMEKGFSAIEASAYLSKLRIRHLSENDNGSKNVDFNLELRMPADRMKRFINKKGGK